MLYFPTIARRLSDGKAHCGAKAPPSAIASAFRAPCHDVRFCSSHRLAFPRTSDLHARNKRPSLRNRQPYLHDLDRILEEAAYRNLSARALRLSCPTSNISPWNLRFCVNEQQTTCMCSSLEGDHFISWTLTIRERTDSLRRFVLEASKELMELVDAECSEKPFACDQKLVSRISCK